MADGTGKYVSVMGISGIGIGLFQYPFIPIAEKGEKRKMTTAELKQVLENHKHWIKSDCNGWENMKANLYRADLRGADLYWADLRGADLHRANLYGATLYRADLRGADLHGAYMHRADLREVNLCGANLCGVDLRGANLHKADLYRANLLEANMCEAKNVPYIPLACPSDGDFIGWKKAKCNQSFVIVKLKIPEDAQRLSATGMKCRCDKALVLEIQNEYGNTIPLTTVAHSMHDPQFEYRVGETVSVEDFDTDRFNECSTGIHFFINRQDAINY